MQYIKISIAQFIYIFGSVCLINAIQKNTKSNKVNVTRTTIKMTKYTTKNTTNLPSTKIYELNKTTNKTDAAMLNHKNKSFDNTKIKLDLTDLLNEDTRRAKNSKRAKSTSSSSGSASEDKSSKSGKESLEMTTSSSSSEEFKKRSYKTPKSSSERKGWRKWHRKCDRCEEDMKKKWRDRSIAWICGAYQRARRSFKSECMMHYRNCQDGTMFVKIHEHRCKNDSYHGNHFFYDYKVPITDKSSSSRSSASSSSESIGDSSGLKLQSDETDEKSSREKKPRKRITQFLDVTARVAYT